MRETSQQPGLTAEKTKIVFKRLEDQVVEQTLELKFVQELCEGHNASLQNFLRSQSDYFRHIGQGVQLAAGNVDIVSQLIEYAEELVAAVNISVDDAFVKEEAFVAEFTQRSAGHATLLGKKQKLLGWHLLKNSEISLLLKQMRLVTQTLSTLIELVQGPCVANQAAILRSNLLGMLVPLFELAGCMNLNGTVAMAGGTTSLSWIGCEVLQSCAAIHAFINIQRDASGEKELFKATADDLDVFISGFEGSDAQDRRRL